MDNESADLDPIDDESPTSVSDSDALNAGDADTSRDPFEELASEFSERYRNGEMPSVEEYVEKHPELAEEIRDLFPTIAAMEQLKERKAPAKPAEGGLELEQLGDFRILGEIGRGGMGVVYEAEQVSLGRHVAVKVLPKQALLDERHLRRFEREAQTAAKLHHTNIVPVFGVGQQDGFHYIVMQFIPGVGLDKILIALRTMVLDDSSADYHMDSSSRASHANHNAKALLDGNFSKHATMNFASSFTKDTKKTNSSTRSLGGTDATMDLGGGTSASHSAASLSGSFATASNDRRIKSLDADNSVVLGSLDTEYYLSVAKIGQQVADALAYAHEQGTLHRDIKPGNLLLDGAGTVWVADFGLAKLAEQDNVSRTGDLVGTLSYMPPESFSGETDARGDIYALGLTLFEMLAMRPAYFGRDRAKLVKQITDGELPRLSKLNPAVPRDLETIVLKAIAHRPEDRYATARELEEDMQCFLTDTPIKARRMSVPEQFTRWCRKNKLVASLSTAVLSLLLLSSVTFGVLYRQANVASGKAIEAKNLAQARREEADEAQEKAREIAGVAIGELLKRFNDIVSERLPLSTEQSLVAAFGSDTDTEELTSDGELTSDEATDTESQTQTGATVAVAPVTPETAIQAEKYLESFEVLAKSTGKDDEFAPIFADLTIRVGKIQRMLGNNAEALEKFDTGIQIYQAIVTTKPTPSAIIGLASSYNEKGDVIAFTSNPNQALTTFNQARDLCEEYESLLADSPRATYERARTLFLMSMEYRASPGQFRGPGGFGGPGGGPPRERRGPGRRGPGRGGPDRGEPGRGGPERGEPRRGPPDFVESMRAAIERWRQRVPRLQKAIELLEPLVASEANPEYRYLLARCHTSVALNTNHRERDQRHESIHAALQLLEQLVTEAPEVADYKFQLAIAKFFSVDIEDYSLAKRTQLLREVTDVTSGITELNPAISNYALVHVRARLAYANAVIRHADDAFKNKQDNALELLSEAKAAIDLASSEVIDLEARFPNAMKSIGSRFPSASELASQQQYTAAKRDIAAADELKNNGKEAESIAMLTSARNWARLTVNEEAKEIDFDPRRRKLFDAMKLLSSIEMRLAGKDAMKRLLEEIYEQRLLAAGTSKYSDDTKAAVAEVRIYAAQILSAAGESKAAKRLYEKVEAELKPLLNRKFNRLGPGERQDPAEKAKDLDAMRARFLLRHVYDLTGNRKAKEELFPWRGGRRGSIRDPNKPAANTRENRNNRPGRPAE